MELKKPFKDLKIGDKIYCIKFDESTIVHDIPSGNAITECVVKGIEDISDKKRTIYFSKGNQNHCLTVDPIAYLKCSDTKVEDEYDMAINRIIYSPSKKRIRDYMIWVLDVNKIKVDEIKEKCLEFLRRMDMAKEEISKIEDDDADTINLIDAATMAL